MMFSKLIPLAVIAGASAALAVDVQAPVASLLADAAGNGPARTPEKPVTIPFTLQDNLVRLPVTLGRRRLSAVLDSGTGAMLLNRDRVGALAVRETRSQVQAAGAGSEATELRIVELENLTVGPLRFKTLTGFTADVHHLTSSAGFPIDLLLGAATFTAGAVTVDYPRRTVTFGKTGSAGRCAAPIPLNIVHGVPIVEVEITPTKTSAPSRLKLLVDLGTRHHAVMLWGPFVQTEEGKALLASGEPRQIGTGIGGRVDGVVVHAEKVRIGGTEFANLPLALNSSQKDVASGVLDGTLGVPLWEAGKITFDYPAKTLCIDV